MTRELFMTVSIYLPWTRSISMASHTRDRSFRTPLNVYRVSIAFDKQKHGADMRTNPEKPQKLTCRTFPANEFIRCQQPVTCAWRSARLCIIIHW